MDKPPCPSCGSLTFPVGVVPPTPEEAMWGAGNVESYKCQNCGKATRFPRYNHPAKLLGKRSDALSTSSSPFFPQGKQRLFTIYRGKPVGLRFVQMVGKTYRMGNSVRDTHVPFVQFTLICRESGTSLTIGAGSGVRFSKVPISFRTRKAFL